LLATPTISVKDVEAIKSIDPDTNADENEIRIIRLENGGIRITTRAENSDETSSPPEKKDNEQ